MEFVAFGDVGGRRGIALVARAVPLAFSIHFKVPTRGLFNGHVGAFHWVLSYFFCLNVQVVCVSLVVHFGRRSSFVSVVARRAC